MAALPRVLVSYATAAGSTAGIAERIADALRTAGCDAVCRPADPDLDLAGFDALVLGSAVHNMAWLPSAVTMLHRAVASGCGPVWCFSVGALNPRGRFTRYLARKEAERVERQFPADFTAREHRVYGGVLDMQHVPLRGRLFYRLTGARAGDHRDWQAIEAWARNVGTQADLHAAGDRSTAVSSAHRYPVHTTDGHVGIGLPMQSAVEHDPPRCGRRRRRPRAAVGVLALGSVYALLVRPRLLRWGASDDELESSFPGAGLVPGGVRTATMAVTIDAPPSRVWPWLVQMGTDRGGWYSWDLLDNFGRRSADRIHPEWQKIGLGDRFTGKPDGSECWQVAAVEPERFLALRMSLDLRGRQFDPAGRRPRRYTDSTWGFLLTELPGRRTRLLVSGYWALRPRWLQQLVSVAVLEPAHWVMQTRQFANLKRRAEAPPGRADPEAPAGHACIAATPRWPRSAGRRA